MAYPIKMILVPPLHVGGKFRRHETVRLILEQHQVFGHPRGPRYVEDVHDQNASAGSAITASIIMAKSALARVNNFQSSVTWTRSLASPTVGDRRRSMQEFASPDELPQASGLHTSSRLFERPTRSAPIV